MVKKIDEKSCGIVVFKNNDVVRKYLVLKYPGGHMDLAKGHVENNETEHETALRELEEETGIKNLKFVDGYREEIFYTYNKKGHQSHKQVVFFLGETNESDVKISFEHRNFYWLPYEEAYKKMTFDNAKNLVKKAEELLNNLNICKLVQQKRSKKKMDF